MLAYLESDIFDSPAQALVNTVNIVGIMGKGIAKDFKLRYPEMFKEYKAICKANNLDIGQLHLYRSFNKTIINFPTKKHWRSPSKLEYLERGLQTFTTRFEELGLTSVAFPQLGTGNGELHWENTVRPLMERYLKPLPISIFIHTRRNERDFIPERLDRKAMRQYRSEAISERESLNSVQVWKDLVTIIDSERYPADLFDKPQENHITVEGPDTIRIEIEGGDSFLLDHILLDEIWSSLFIRKVITPEDIILDSIAPAYIRETLSLLSKLTYVNPVRLKNRHSDDYQDGIMYSPRSHA